MAGREKADFRVILFFIWMPRLVDSSSVGSNLFGAVVEISHARPSYSSAQESVLAGFATAISQNSSKGARSK